MKKFLFSFVFIFSLTTWANYDPIIHIPDANFKAKLLAASPSNEIARNLADQWFKIDSNNDGEIQVSEAFQVKHLNVRGFAPTPQSMILNLEGILNFVNLQDLFCNQNKLTNLNLQGLTNLKTLVCWSNLLTLLNVQDCTNLETINCSNNFLTALNFQSLTNLQSLGCGSNNLSILNIQGLNNLQSLNCGVNNLTSLNVQGLTNLVSLSCDNNQLTSLNLTGLNNLEMLMCYFNQITNLYLDGCINLNEIDCSINQIITLNVQEMTNLQKLTCHGNELVSLFMKNGYPNLQYYFLQYNYDLIYICCSDNQLTSVQSKVNGYGYTNCQVNTYCSFTPGGNYNTITGQFKYDFDNIGCNANDLPVINAKLTSPSFTGSNTIYANSQGQYNGYTLQGTHNITPQIENPSLFNITPPSAQITFIDSNNNTQTQNFCITPNGNQTDVEVVFTPLNPARPGFDADYKIVYRNIGNQVANGDVALTYMSDRIDLVSSSVAPTTQTSEQLIWNYQNLLPFETRTINLTFNINSPMETPPVNNGDLLSYGAYITPLDNDINAFNNTSGLRQEVVGSYDPNDKTCLQGNTPGPEFIGQYVHYLIRFENTGTFFAENVVVRDDIDLAKFDINSLVVLDASHDMLVTRINGNRVEFIFEGIQLPFPPSEERHGYVLFKIKTKSNLTVGSTFANQAGIYFDYNWPIITNDEVSTITLLGTPSFEFSDLISLYPNPAHEVINLSAKAGINLKSIEIYNTMGQLLMAVPNNMNQLEINVSHLHSGSYFLKVHTDDGVGHAKFVKAP